MLSDMDYVLVYCSNDIFEDDNVVVIKWTAHLSSRGWVNSYSNNIQGQDSRDPYALRISRLEFTGKVIFVAKILKRPPEMKTLSSQRLAGRCIFSSFPCSDAVNDPQRT